MTKVHTWDVNGKRQIDVPFSEKLEIRSDEDTTTLIIRCFFTEQYTNRTTIKEEKIVVYASKYKVIKANKRLTYLPGSSFTAKFNVTYHNDEPAILVTLLVEVEGNIVGAGFFRPNQMNRYPFKLLMSEKLIPRSKIFVATIVRKSFIYGDVELSINDFGNPLEIKIEENISEDGVDPGDEIELGIRGRPGAYVSLAAYDQRLMQQIVEYRGNHDIVFAEVWEMFDNYFDRSRYSYDKLTDLGIFAVVTDDTIQITSEPSVFNVWHSARGIYPDAPRYGMPGPYRTDFWESWLWQNLTIPPSGRAELVVTVPHSTTSWFITGISIDPKYGLGIVNKPITFSTVKIFFILDHLPHSIKRGETISLHFTIFSSMQEVFEATVTLFNSKNQLLLIDRPAEDMNETKSVFVPANSDASVSFLVKAMKLGELEIQVNASIMQGVISDSFKKIVMVHPEDVVVLRSKRIQFDRDSPSNQSFDIPLLMDNKAEDRDVPVDLIVYPDQQSLKDLQNSYNVSVYHDRFEELMHVNSDFHENITIKSIPLIWDLYHLNGKIARKLSVIVMSSGSGTIQINWQYRLNLIYFKPRFNLQITKLPTPTKWMKELHICCSFIPKKRDNHSNGTVVEVSIPIGYAMDSHNVVEETTINPMSRIEILHDGTTVLVYFNHMGNEASCFSVFAYRRYKNRVRHPSYIKVQDFYRPALNIVKMFDFH
ncbi:uncharacterized protein LOC125955437 [Anopheles darlingi]|uniref:uncharacterized protein LOC125955437 n=1 Tax=Anopheles darlingi TaxID=43151 RepID=UPI0020FFFD49|nr:uncharacterized protein LOC125955437 [Anopheles darlingi]